MIRLVAPIAVLVVIAVSMPVTSHSSVPPYMSYQGRLTDGVGLAVDTTVSITFTIYTDDGTNTVLWSESHPTVVVADGLFNVVLGLYTPLTSEVFDGGVRQLGVTVGSEPESNPRVLITSVAYAQRSAAADTAQYALTSGSSGVSGWVDDGDVVRLENPDDLVGIGTDTPTANLEVDGEAKITGDLQIGDYSLMSKKLSVSFDGAKDTIPLWSRNLNGTAAGFFSHATGTGHPTSPHAMWAYAGDSANVARFHASGDGYGLYSRTEGSGNALHGYAAGTGYSGYFEGGSGLKVVGDLEATGSFKLPTGASDGWVLTSDASGVASWQAGASGSPWSVNGPEVFLADTSMHVGIGTDNPAFGNRLSVLTSGGGVTQGLWVRNRIGTAASFFSADSGNSVPGTGTAVYARAGEDNNAGYFSALGNGDGVMAFAGGTGRAVYASNTGTGYSGLFSGGNGVYVNGKIVVSNPDSTAWAANIYGGKGLRVANGFYSVNSDYYSGRFAGGLGVKVEGDLETTGALKLPTGAASGYVLTSDHLGTASWQPGASMTSHWTLDGSDVVLADTSHNVSLGDTTGWTAWTKLSVETSGGYTTSALRARNTTGTAARFYSGGPGTTYSSSPAAIYALGEDSAKGALLTASGTGYALHATTTGSNYAARFWGGARAYLSAASLISRIRRQWSTWSPRAASMLVGAWMFRASPTSLPCLRQTT